jgi:hypothetical protein
MDFVIINIGKNARHVSDNILILGKSDTMMIITKYSIKYKNCVFQLTRTSIFELPLIVTVVQLV